MMEGGRSKRSTFWGSALPKSSLTTGQTGLAVPQNLPQVVTMLTVFQMHSLLNRKKIRLICVCKMLRRCTTFTKDAKTKQRKRGDGRGKMSFWSTLGDTYTLSVVLTFNKDIYGQFKKVYFVIHSLIQPLPTPHFSKKGEIFTSTKAFR